MNWLSATTLRTAIQTGARVDATATLGLRSRPPGTRPQRLDFSGHIPPTRFAAYQRERLTLWNNLASAPEGPLSLRAFERLSLATRTKLFNLPSLKERGKQAGRSEEARRKQANAIALLGLKAELPSVDAADLAVVLRECAGAHAGSTPQGLQLVGCRIRNPPGAEKTPLNLSNLFLPFPISFIGCVFEMPLMLNETSVGSLDLSGSALWGLEARGLQSVGDVHLRRTTVISAVNFAGATIGGMFDASDLLVTPMERVHPLQVMDADHGVLNLSKVTVRNDLVLERARIWGGLSMRGAEAQRSVFLTGAIVASPMGVLEKWAADKIGPTGEFAAALRPLNTGSFASAAETLAKNKLHAADLPRSRPDPDPPQSPPDQNAVAPAAPALEPDCDALVALETVRNIGDLWDSEALESMLTESLRARTNAIRADGLVVAGNLFAEHLSTAGRVRLKSARIDGSIRLAGASLRSGEEGRRFLAEIQRVSETPEPSSMTQDERAVREAVKRIVKLRHDTGYRIDHPEAFVPQDFALDLREAQVGGDVSFQTGEQTPGDRKGPDDPWGDHRAKAYGVLAFGGATINGSLRAISVQFHWRPMEGAPVAEGLDYYNRQKIEDADRTLRETPALTAQVKANRLYSPGDRRPLSKQCAVLMRQTVVGKDVDFRESHGLWGVDLEEARIAGRLRFCQRHSGRRVDTDRRVVLTGRATLVGGVLNLRGAKIESDCSLVFHPDYGPDIKAAHCFVDGELGIYPATDAQRYVYEPDRRARPMHPSEHEAYRQASAEFEWRACNHRWRRVSPENGLRLDADAYRRETKWTLWARHFVVRLCTWLAAAFTRVVYKERSIECFDCGLVFERRRNRERDRHEWAIDLRNGKATIFCHPPSAWTHPGALSLDGFRYERSSGLGPLPPITSDNLLPQANPIDPIRSIRYGGLLLLLLSLGVSAHALYQTRPAHLVFVAPLLLAAVMLAPHRQITAPLIVNLVSPMAVGAFSYLRPWRRRGLVKRWRGAVWAHRRRRKRLARTAHLGTKVFFPGMPVEDQVLLGRQVLTSLVLLAGAGFFAFWPDPLDRWRLIAPLLGAATLAGAPFRHFLARADNPLGDRTLAQDRRSLGRKLLVAVPTLLVLLAIFHAINAETALAWMDNGFRLVVASSAAYLITAQLTRWFLAPQPLQHRSMGVEYLARQRTDANRFQFLTSRYSPNETYRQAAQALREAGRYLSANEVERIRLFNREKLLSWRRHGVSKVFLKGANLLSGFGFKLDRLAVLIACLTLLVAFGCHWTAYMGWLVPDPKEPKWTLSLEGDAAARPTALTGAYHDVDPVKAKVAAKQPRLSCAERAGIAPDNSGIRACPGLVYAIDLLLPVDLGQDAWKVSDKSLGDISKPYRSETTGKVKETHPLLQGAARNAIALVQLLGAMLAAFFLAVVAIRAEAAFSRVEE